MLVILGPTVYDLLPPLLLHGGNEAGCGPLGECVLNTAWAAPRSGDISTGTPGDKEPSSMMAQARDLLLLH